MVDGRVEGTYSDVSSLDTHKLYWRWGETGAWQSKAISGGTFEQSFPELGQSSFRLTPTTLLHLVVEDDDLLTAQVALLPPQDLNIAISDGQFGDQISEDKEESEGAVTVANLNDTDADGIIDNVDDGNPGVSSGSGQGGVFEYRSEQELLPDQMLGRHEVDLMKLVIYKPKVYNDGDNINLVVNEPGRVKLWYDSAKRQPVANYNRTTGVVSGVFGEWGIDAESFPTVTIWVEITDKSLAVGDISIEATLRGAVDKVVATGVWAELTATESATKDWGSLEGTLWDLEMDEHLQEQVRKIGGTGLQSSVNTFADSPDIDKYVFDNTILFQWTISPANVCDVLERVEFDNARQYKFEFQDRLAAIGQRLQDASADLPNHYELPNDEITQPFNQSGDGGNPTASSNGHMYGMDSPNIRILLTYVGQLPQPAGLITYNFSALEFLRVAFKPDPNFPDDNQVRPSRNAIQGSITSVKTHWLSDISISFEQEALNTQILVRAGNNRIELEN